MVTKKEKKLRDWRRHKNAPVICEDTHFLTSNIAVHGILTICDGKSDTEWDNAPTDGNQTLERLGH